MRAKLISRQHGEFVFGREATIGRAAGCDLRLDAAMVSTEHARIRFDSERAGYEIEDLGSLNGTKLDGVRIERPERLGRLHVLSFGGGEELIFQTLDASVEEEPETIELSTVGKTQVGMETPVLPDVLRQAAAGADLSRAAAADGGTRIEQDVVPLPEILKEAGEKASGATQRAAAATGPRLELELQLEDRVERFPLREGENLVGRSPKANIRLELPDLSRRHAVLTVAAGRVSVRDEGSSNHTFVGGEKIDGEVEVSVGGRIAFGRVEARLRESSPEGDRS